MREIIIIIGVVVSLALCAFVVGMEVGKDEADRRRNKHDS